MRPIKAITLGLAALGGAAAGQPLAFTDVTVEAGITHRHAFAPPDTFNFLRWFAGGAVAEDFDGDGWIDLFVTQGYDAPCLLYMGQGDGTFVDEAAERGADTVTFAMAAAAADFDSDGDIDLCVTTLTPPHFLLINDETGHFAVDQITLAEPSHGATSPSWGDIDNDGKLELMIGRWADEVVNLWIYPNSESGLGPPLEIAENPPRLSWVFAPRFADLNGDRLSDLAVIADFGNSQVWLNRGDGVFENATVAAGTGAETNGMGNAIGDYDNDGDLDWFTSSIWRPDPFPFFDVGNRLYRNRDDATFEDVTFAANVHDGNWGWGSAFGDLDLDGLLDIYHVNGYVNENALYPPHFNDQPARLFHNRGDGAFDEVAAAAGADNHGQGRGLALADFDNDGDLDIFIANNQDLMLVSGEYVAEPGTPALLRNDTPTDHHWLKVSLAGSPPFHSHGIGNRVHATTGDVTQMRELNASTGYMGHGPERIAHFGLGDAASVDEVRAEWVDGNATVAMNVSADQWITLRSPAGTVEPRTVWSGESVFVSGSGVSPASAERDWLVQGTAITDESEVPLLADGPASVDLLLRIFGEDGVTPIHQEIHRVTVLGPMPAGLTLGESPAP